MIRVSFENLATLTEKGRLPRVRWRIGLPSRKTRQKRGPIDSTSIGAGRLGIDAQSGVFWPAAQVRCRFATDFATELAFKASGDPGRGGGGLFIGQGVVIHTRKRVRNFIIKCACRS